jgi:hypothetical protein
MTPVFTRGEVTTHRLLPQHLSTAHHSPVLTTSILYCRQPSLSTSSICRPLLRRLPTSVCCYLSRAWIRPESSERAGPPPPTGVQRSTSDIGGSLRGGAAEEYGAVERRKRCAAWWGRRKRCAARWGRRRSAFLGFSSGAFVLTGQEAHFDVSPAIPLAYAAARHAPLLLLPPRRARRPRHRDPIREGGGLLLPPWEHPAWGRCRRRGARPPPPASSSAWGHRRRPVWR